MRLLQDLGLLPDPEPRGGCMSTALLILCALVGLLLGAVIAVAILAG